jgi:hypothetical protein
MTDRPNQTKSSEDAFGAAVAHRLSDSVDTIPHDISERLKAARVLAVAKRKVVKVEAATAVSVSGATASLNGKDHPIWGQLASLVPLFALVIGLIVIGFIQDELRTNDIANVDTEILTDELPPEAYTDPGFAQFLRAQRGD